MIFFSFIECVSVSYDGEQQDPPPAAPQRDI